MRVCYALLLELSRVGLGVSSWEAGEITGNKEEVLLLSLLLLNSMEIVIIYENKMLIDQMKLPLVDNYEY